MTLSTVLFILRCVLMSLSFFGLCAAARRGLKLNRFIAPYFAACLVICILMFGGMLRVLKYSFYLLYFGGFAGLVYAYIVKREKPDWLLIALFALFAGYLAWRMGPETLREWDDLSHWGLVARQLLQTDAFPNASTPAVTFQAYPLGAASFIYYVGRTIANTEGVYLFAQNLLYGLFFLPVLAHVRGNQKWLYPAAGCLFWLLFRFDRSLLSLFTDWQLSILGTGTAAAVLYYRDDWKKAMLAGLPGIVAVVYLKSSGLFFMATGALLLAWVAKNCGMKRSRVLLTLIISAGAGVLAYFLWTTHVRLSFDAGMATKHAVSLSKYAKTGSMKSMVTILRIVKRMLLALVKPYFFQVYAVLFMVGCFLVNRFAGRRRDIRRGLWLSIGFYAVWHIMIFFTYVFSMSTAEALRLASYWRYSSTGLVYMMGLAGILMLNLLSHAKIGRLAKCAGAGAMAATLAVSPWFIQKPETYYPEYVVRSKGYSELRQGVIQAREAYDLPEDGEYLIYAGGDVIINAVNAYFRAVKYDLNSLNIDTLARVVPQMGEKQAVDEYTFGTPAPAEWFADPTDMLEERLQNYDAFLILFKDERFEQVMDSFLKTYAGETPVIFIYR